MSCFLHYVAHANIKFSTTSLKITCKEMLDPRPAYLSWAHDQIPLAKGGSTLIKAGESLLTLIHSVIQLFKYLEIEGWIKTGPCLWENPADYRVEDSGNTHLFESGASERSPEERKMAGPWWKEVNRGRRKVTGFEANDTACAKSLTCVKWEWLRAPWGLQPWCLIQCRA